MKPRNPVQFSGWKLTNSRRVRMKILPAENGTTIVFNNRLIAAVPYARAWGNCTCLIMDGKRVLMVEHLLAACYALRMTSLNFQLDTDTVPFGDGSALPFVRALIRGGFKRTTNLDPLRLKKPVMVRQGKRVIIALPSKRLRINCLLSHPDVGEQFFSGIITRKSFIEQIAPARTFGRFKDIVGLEQCLGFRIKIINGWVFPQRWRFKNEPCRHKVLDLLGDLALLSQPLQAQNFAFNPGHRLNLRLVRKITELEEK
ncbi:MAG: UDP-3-O-acyl-N-acetylglucosamine deacetylase [bacterium]